MVLTGFCWPHGGQQVFIAGSFSSWAHYSMMQAGGAAAPFQFVCDLPPGFYQYRFLVDGIWRYDEQQPHAIDDYGAVNNFICIREAESFVIRTMDVDDGIALHTAPSASTVPPELVPWISDAELEASRQWISRLLLNQTVFDLLPMSNKVSILDGQLAVKVAFQVMYDEGLYAVPIWDDQKATVAGMLTASDFILMLRELQQSTHTLANQELENFSIFAWKEAKSQRYQESNGPLTANPRPLIHVLDQDCLRDLALKIVQNEISAVPVFKSALQDESCMTLLHPASLPGILKFICDHYRDPLRMVPLLQHPICGMPLGTWLQQTGRGNGRQLALLQRNAPLSNALDLLLKARISSIPIVDDNGSLIDIYSRSDIVSFAKADMYARVQIDQITMEQALALVYQANPAKLGLRRCYTCFRTTTFHEVIEQLSNPAVRRLVVINPRSRRVEGIVTLRDIFVLLLSV